jgi:Family of unknown function (DUF6962)
MTEPDVTLTDYFLALEAALLGLLVWKGHASENLRMPFVLFFGSTAAAALIGGTVHGFFAGATTAASVALWRATLIALGLTAFAAWMIGSRMLLAPGTANAVRLAAAVVLAFYVVIVVAVDDRFWVAIVHYLPPTLVMLAAFAAAAFRTRSSSAFSGLMGMILTLVAAVVQQGQIALHPVYFNHNALYHAIQAIALWLIYVGSASGHAYPQAR